LSDLGLYDQKYLLLLNAIDGFARTISAGLTVHDSEYPENDKWLQAAMSGVASSHLLNESLRVRHPYPAFWAFGLPIKQKYDKQPDPIPPVKYLQVQARAQSFLVHSFINPKHGLRNRFDSINQKLNRLLTRKQRHQMTRDDGTLFLELDSDIQSLDF
jgi:hypothetical protein